MAPERGPISRVREAGEGRESSDADGGVFEVKEVGVAGDEMVGAFGDSQCYEVVVLRVTGDRDDFGVRGPCGQVISAIAGSSRVGE